MNARKWIETDGRTDRHKYSDRYVRRSMKMKRSLIYLLCTYGKETEVRDQLAQQGTNKTKLFNSFSHIFFNFFAKKYGRM